MIERMLKIDEVSVLLQISPKTLYNWVCEGRIPYFKVGGRSKRSGALRFRQSDIERWVRRSKNNPRIPREIEV